MKLRFIAHGLKKILDKYLPMIKQGSTPNSLIVAQGAEVELESDVIIDVSMDLAGRLVFKFNNQIIRLDEHFGPLNLMHFKEKETLEAAAPDSTGVDVTLKGYPVIRLEAV